MLGEGRRALALALALGCAVRTDARIEYGEFGPDYNGGDDYRFDDPAADELPLKFSVDDGAMTCDSTRTPFDEPFRGVGLGGWLLLEPWITPSLFYQFLGADKRFGDDVADNTGLDMYTFCQALGPEEGNVQLRRHWRTWVTEEDIKKLAKMNINSLRIPVGDWMWRPYGPYVNCTAGSLDELDRVLDLAHKYGLKAVIDLHGVVDSQNGFDNSGMMRRLEWDYAMRSSPVGSITFAHWPMQEAGWLGTWDGRHVRQSTINWGNVDLVVDVLRMIADQYKDHPAVIGLQPLNEPWQFTPVGPLKRFYWEGYKAMKRRAPGWLYMMHDSFRPRLDIWEGFMKGCDGVLLDSHMHQAWSPQQPAVNFFLDACGSKDLIQSIEQRVMPLVVGEFSLASDNCAMWLNGFNDNLNGFPMVECDWTWCADPYMGPEQPGAPPDPAKADQGPFGTGESTPRFGWCPIDRAWPDGRDDEITTAFAHKKLNGFLSGQGWFFWNFKTELEPKWDYMRSVEKGWMPEDALTTDAVRTACNLEDKSSFICRAKDGVKVKVLHAQVEWACSQPYMAPIQWCLGTSADSRADKATEIFTYYWKAHRKNHTWATCDFDGAAELVPDYSHEWMMEEEEPFGALPPSAFKLLRAGAPVFVPSPERTAMGALTAALGGFSLVALAALGAHATRRAIAARRAESELREHLAAASYADADEIIVTREAAAYY